ncbi:MAG TPA: hypothetical protein VFC19_01850 [Candidatus Limnocylindrales bacterium]|nr:hypothetical protein [Candidatus Limnocylindrales bacterium]
MNNDIQLAARSDDWLEAGLSCEPTDRAAAEKGVLVAYESAGLPAPQRILWAGSPRAGAKIVAALDDPGASVRPKVRTRPWAAARQELLHRLGPGFARHWIATTRRPWLQLVDQIATPMRTRLDAHFAAEAGQDAARCRQALLDVILGQHDAAWLGAFLDDSALEDRGHGLVGLAQVARNAGWWWAFERVAVICERHVEVHRDNLGRLHRGDGPALSYPDGYGIHSWRGMPIPPEIVAELATLTVERIQAESNAEMRRVMLEHFGFERYLRESGAKKQHADEFGTLWRVDIPGDEPLVMVEVINSTAEPDGSFRTYFLRVPPQTGTARAGVAWTFGLSEQEYVPTKQT